MYKNYKSTITTQPKKLGLPKGKQKNQNQVSQQVIKPKPEWNDSVKDESNYKLSTSELVQKKISLMSKHRLEAKEEWLERQEKLRNGVFDEETKKIYDTARQSKNLSTRDDDFQRKNLSQMLNFIPKPQKDPKTISEQVNNNLKQTRKFIEKMEQYQNDEDPNRVLRVMDRLHSNKEQILNKHEISNFQQTSKGFGSLRKSARSMSNQNMHSQRSSSQNEQRLSDKKLTQVSQTGDDFFSSSTKENKQEMANYFNSLDKIEETIKFMEDKILGEKKSPKKQSIAPSSIIEKKLFNEIQEINENVYEDFKNKMPSYKEHKFDEEDLENEVEFSRNQTYFVKPNNKMEGRTIDMRGILNGSKQINTSRGSKTIDNDGVSFNLTDGEDESLADDYRNRLEQSKHKTHNRSESQSSEKRQFQNYGKELNNNMNNNKDQDLIVNDFKCNIDVIDPNMFFSNNDNGDDEFEYEYSNNKQNTVQPKKNNDDTLKSDYQKNYENTLTNNNNNKFQQKLSIAQNYDLIAEQKKKELNSQQNKIKFQYNNTNDIYSRLKQQTEDDSDQFYQNRVIPQPQSNNFFKQTQNEVSNQYNKPIANSYPQKQAQEQQQEEEEDYLSRNIDSLKEMLEATRKDLENLENNQSSNNEELNYFSSQYTKQNEGTIQGRRVQNSVLITRNNEHSNIQQGVKKINNNLLDMPDAKESSIAYNNPPLVNTYKQLERNTGAMFITDTKSSNNNNLFQTENEQQNFFTSNIFLSNNPNQQGINSNGTNSYKNQSDPYFTSNVFMNNNNNEKQDYSNSLQNNDTFKTTNITNYKQDQSNLDNPRHCNVVKQDMFKKSLQNYSNQGIKPQDSLNIRHHLK